LSLVLKMKQIRSKMQGREGAIMTDIVTVLVTVSGEEEAVRIARSLVQERLAACANLVPGIRSIYRWKGEIWDTAELLLLIKTRAALFPALQQRIRQLHSYEVPEIVALPIIAGWPDYLNWVQESTQEPSWAGIESGFHE
jgi:periplasmic divalent cation tolerance protein